MLNGYRTLEATGRILGVTAEKVLELIEHGPLVGRLFDDGSLLVHDEDLQAFRRPHSLRAFVSVATATTDNNLPTVGGKMYVTANISIPLGFIPNEEALRRLSGAAGATETWAWVPGSDRHEVSTLGRVRSWRKGKSAVVLPEPIDVKPRNIAEGYLGFGVQTRLHTAVLLAFVGPCPAGHEAAHRNGDRHDNRLENLRWATHAENIADKVRHGTCSSRREMNLGPEEIAAIRRRRAQGESRTSVAEAFGVTPQTVSNHTRGSKTQTRHLQVVR